MKPFPLVLIALVAGALPATVIQVLDSPAPAERPAPVESPRLAMLAETVAATERRQASLEEAIAGLRADLAQRSEAADPRVPTGAIEAAVDRALAQRGGPSAAPRDAAPAGEQAAARETPELEIDDVMTRLLSDDFTAEVEREEYWMEVREAGLLDEVVARFEERAQRAPNDPDAQVDLGQVYLQKIFEVGQSPLAGVWATKADEAFDAALDVDDRHWGARFSKAASLSFWPPVFGKQSEAIEQFEILAEQQETMTAEPRHAQTYLLLGNLYQQNGRPEKALEAWRRGLSIFPDDAALVERIELED